MDNLSRRLINTVSMEWEGIVHWTLWILPRC